MESYLNQALGFDEVRWATMRKTSYDSRASFRGAPQKKILPAGTRLYCLVPIVIGSYFDSPWWMPEAVFSELHDDANRGSHGGGRLLMELRYRVHGAAVRQLPVVCGRDSVDEISVCLDRALRAAVRSTRWYGTDLSAQSCRARKSQDERPCNACENVLVEILMPTAEELPSSAPARARTAARTSARLHRAGRER